MNYRNDHQLCISSIVRVKQRYNIWLILLVMIASLYLFSQSSFAQQVPTANDCNEDYSLIKSDDIIGVKNNTLFPQQLLDIARENHTAYCCDHYPWRMQSTSICQTPSIRAKRRDNTYAESPVFYDHLIDIGFRYLDGIADKQYTTNNGVAILDAQGQTWHEQSMAIVSSPYGYMPSAIRQLFGQARGMNSTREVAIHTSCEDNKKQYTDFSNNREKKSLADKYFIICHATQCLNPYKKATDTTDISKCMQLAEQRISQEMDRIQSVMIVQGNNAILSSFQAYAQWFFVQDQMNKLLEKYSEMEAWFNFLNNKVPEIVPVCS